MKKLCLALLLLSTAVIAQDKIVTIQSDTIHCKIYLIVDGSIFYKTSKTDTVYTGINLKDVFWYQKVDGNIVMINGSKSEYKFKTAGDELIKATNHYYTGFALTVIGTGVAFVLSSSSNTNKAPVYFGVGLAFIGAITMLESHSHIKKAGKILNQSTIGMVINSNGVGVNLRF